MKIPKLIATDIDGVWTDGGMYYDQSEMELKKFNTSDSVGVLWAKMNDIPLAILTGENTQIVQRRADKLKIAECHLGVKNKVALMETLLNKYKIQWEDVAYIGDDINDILLLEKVGYSGCPNNAPDYIKSRVKYVSKINGGQGAFRDFVENILDANNLLDKTINAYIKNQRELHQ
jgi:3-deoxy-D-manno-octulosonate 8-phosphate phosphatase (KDO 8-P phosphatase)